MHNGLEMCSWLKDIGLQDLLECRAIVGLKLFHILLDSHGRSGTPCKSPEAASVELEVETAIGIRRVPPDKYLV